MLLTNKNIAYSRPLSGAPWPRHKTYVSMVYDDMEMIAKNHLKVTGLKFQDKLFGLIGGWPNVFPCA